MSCRKKTGWRGPRSLAVSAGGEQRCLGRIRDRPGRLRAAGPRRDRERREPIAAAPAPAMMIPASASSSPVRRQPALRAAAGPWPARAVSMFNACTRGRHVGRARPLGAGVSIVSPAEAPQRIRRSPALPYTVAAAASPWLHRSTPLSVAQPKKASTWRRSLSGTQHHLPGRALSLGSPAARLQPIVRTRASCPPPRPST